MPAGLQRNLILALLLSLAPGFATAQEPDYYQTTVNLGGYGNTRFATSGVTLVINRISPTFRVPVQTTPEQPLGRVEVRGYRDMYCVSTRIEKKTKPGEFGSAQNPLEGELNFREALYSRLAALDSAAMQVALQRAANATDRAAQYRELFGVNLPALTGEFPSYDEAALDEAAQMQLNTGQPTTVAFNVVCATPAQVDAAIAEARRVYAAVIAAMQGGGTKGGLTAKPSPGLQTQNPKGK